MKVMTHGCLWQFLALFLFSRSLDNLSPGGLVGVYYDSSLSARIQVEAVSVQYIPC
jgi:hypothetical protein